MGDMKSLPALCKEILGHVDTSKHEQGVLIHNAGTMNEFAPLASRDDPQKIQDYFGINFTSMVVLTNHFLSTFTDGHPRYVINISSLLATVYLPGFDLYTSSRAARNAFMGSLGAEIPDVRQLTYTPGPCDTDMHRAVPQGMIKMMSPVLTAEQSIQKFVGILKENRYKNGAIIDYYDD